MSHPKAFSAYLVVASDEPSIQVGSVLIDKGVLLERIWDVMNFKTGKSTSAVGQRLSRLCPECRVEHKVIGILGHVGECGGEDSKQEARQVLDDARKRIEVSA